MHTQREREREKELLIERDTLLSPSFSPLRVRPPEIRPADYDDDYSNGNGGDGSKIRDTLASVSSTGMDGTRGGGGMKPFNQRGRIKKEEKDGREKKTTQRSRA